MCSQNLCSLNHWYGVGAVKECVGIRRIAGQKNTGRLLRPWACHVPGDKAQERRRPTRARYEWVPSGTDRPLPGPPSRFRILPRVTLTLPPCCAPGFGESSLTWRPELQGAVSQAWPGREGGCAVPGPGRWARGGRANPVCKWQPMEGGVARGWD